MPAPLVALAAPYLIELAKNGLNLLAGAIQAKGKEIVENQLGVKIPESPAAFTPEKLTELKKLEIQHEEFLVNAQIQEKQLELDADKTAQQQVSDRWKFDMSSDSWLSKNVRPITLVYWTLAISILVILDTALKEAFQVRDEWIELIKYSYEVILAAYFIGRTVQHGIRIAKTRK
jgi:hypothetical protein